MQRMELIVDDFSALSRASRLLASYLNSSVRMSLLSRSATSLMKIQTPVLIARERAIKSPLALFLELIQAANRPLLLGSTKEEQAQVSSWVELSRSMATPDLLHYTDSHLARRDFLVTPKLTLADIVAFAHIRSEVPPDFSVPNLKRWLQTVQQTPGLPTSLEESPAILHSKPSSPATEKPPKTEKPSKPPPLQPLDLFSLLNIRIGRVVNVWKHPERDRIFCQEIDFGNGEVRTIASGLVGVVREEELRGQLVVVLTNLKARKMGEFVSQGMVLCGSKDGVIELARPPTSAQPGDCVTIEGAKTAPLSELPPKKGYWEQAQPQFSISTAGVALYDGRPLQTSVGVVTVASLRSGSIS